MKIQSAANLVLTKLNLLDIIVLCTGKGFITIENHTIGFNVIFQLEDFSANLFE